MIAREREKYLTKKKDKELQITSEQEVAEVSREEKKEPLDIAKC
jgi:hypothetical protein